MREIVLGTGKNSGSSYVVETLVFCPSAVQKLESRDTYETEIPDRLTVDTI
ncbi:hypothetical protein PHLCEN_2v4771 [Hermanssonia centrifuga]|uniref:Uncharacterized protein n=1 Tax=Hermanssonia centrifuga TaxID=98765 RepID=A0A2R6PK28_9APHY|nr:hypothetical protein PHLCEN_2v4771 [Hermanssonia centrifuga]